MYENVLERILINNLFTKNEFIGVFARDELPPINKYPVSFIINTQPRNKEGEHWLAIFIDSYKNCFFFDSYGQSPSFYNLQNFIKTSSYLFYYNQSRIQGLKPYCGLYCLFFLLAASKNKIYEFFKQFTSNLFKNDKLIYLNYINYFQ